MSNELQNSPFDKLRANGLVRCFHKKPSGFTLIEMIIAIVIISVGLAGVLLAFNTTVKSSADPLIHKQMLAVAEEMMEEILLKPFVDPENDAAPSNSPTTCGIGAARIAFDDVFDYNNYETTGICNVDGDTVTGLENYDIKATIDPSASLGSPSSPSPPVGSVKKVTVVVTHGSETLNLIGWRTNYAAEP